ncbi:hypothetical protein [Saccharothrix xinjiangensis]|uniref:Transcriptional regulator n=1 Tax=Saccharothrix xinjiangensis TaxID=204798 RepID=A0ABV9Y215_9PSEU
MPEPNDLLRAARERTASAALPAESMSRRELAEAVNNWLWKTTGKRYSLDAHTIARYERGAVRWPGAHYRAGLRHVLGAATDAELGFRASSTLPVVSPSAVDRGVEEVPLPGKGAGSGSIQSVRGAPSLESVDRKTFLTGAVGAGIGIWATRQRPVAVVDTDDLATAISGPTAHYRRMESAISSDQLVGAVEAHLRLAKAVVADKLRTQSGFRVLSETAGLAAWLAFDRDDHATARTRYADAVGYAQRAGHSLLAAYMTASLGHFAVEEGHARPGVMLLDRANTQLDATAPDSARAWLASLHAVGHAALGDRTATYRALRAAERLTGRGRGEPQWPWVFGFDRAKAARYRAAALARLGDTRTARDAYTEAEPSLTAPKPRALAQVEHAHLLAADGLIEQGCDLAVKALAVGRTYGSERITARVRRFRESLPAHTREASALDDALAALYERET